jgi:peptidoglycan/LPS O-acetylase OafA/YrhL
MTSPQSTANMDAKPVPMVITKVFQTVILYTIAYSFIPYGNVFIFHFFLRDFLYFLILVFAIPVLFSHFKNDKLDVRIGDLSYSIYLLHMLIARLCNQLSYPFLKSAFTVALIAIGLSLLLNIFISVPIEKYRQKRLKRTKLIIKSPLV